MTKLQIVHAIDKTDSQASGAMALERLMENPGAAAAIKRTYEVAPLRDQSDIDFAGVNRAIDDLAASGLPGRYCVRRGDLARIHFNFRSLIIFAPLDDRERLVDTDAITLCPAPGQTIDQARELFAPFEARWADDKAARQKDRDRWQRISEIEEANRRVQMASGQTGPTATVY